MHGRAEANWWHGLNQNLGANAAAFAIYNEELSDLVLHSGYDVMRGNRQFAYMTNGYEQQFSALTTVGRQLPDRARWRCWVWG